MKTMKNSLLALLAVSVLSVGSYSASASQVDTLSLAQLNVALIQATSFDLINWKVGDTQTFNIKMSLPFPATMEKSVTKDEGTAIWVKQAASIMGQNDISEMLMSKADGKILKFIHNGKEEQMPANDIEIISQDVTEVTVPAGNFKAIHVVAKSKQSGNVELWANPQATVMEGTLKIITDSQMGQITIELASFKHGA